MNGRPSAIFKTGETVAGVAIEGVSATPAGEGSTICAAQPIDKESGLGLTVLKKIIELYGGVLDVTGSQYTILFKVQRKQ